MRYILMYSYLRDNMEVTIIASASICKAKIVVYSVR